MVKGHGSTLMPSWVAKSAQAWTLYKIEGDQLCCGGLSRVEGDQGGTLRVMRGIDCFPWGSYGSPGWRF